MGWLANIQTHTITLVGGGEAHGECSAVQASPLPLLVPPPPQTPPLGGRAVRRQLRSAGPLGPAVQAATAWAAVGMGRACCCPPGSPHPFCCTPNKKIKKRGKKRENSEHAGDRPTSTPSAARCGRATAVEGRGERERPGGRLGQGGSGCCTPPPVQWAIHPWRQQQQPIAPRGAGAARIWRAAAHLRPMGCTRAYIWHAPPPSAPSAHMARRPLAAPAAHRRRHEWWGSIPPRGGRGGGRCRHRGHIAAGWSPQSEAGGLTLGGRPPTAASSSGAARVLAAAPTVRPSPPQPPTVAGEHDGM